MPSEPLFFPSANHHSHTHFSDGVGDPEEYVQAALAAGLTTYGFSDHAPLPSGETGLFDLADLPAYVAETQRLIDKYAGKIELYRSLEVDYLGAEMNVNSDYLQPAELAYTVGAVHYVGRLATGERWSFQRPDPIFQRGIDEIFGGSVQKCVECYFELIREMVSDHPPDVVAHLDRILKRNVADRFWDRTAKWYRHAILETLEAVAASGCIMELNTRGMYRNDNTTTYPGPFAAAEARRLGVHVHLSSDAHAPEQVVLNFEDGMAVLRGAGYESVRVFRGGVWVDEELVF